MILSATSLVCVLSFGAMTPVAFTTQMHSVVSSLAVDVQSDQGMIVSVNQDEKTFELIRSDNIRITFRVNDETVFYLDGERSTMSEALSVGHTATVRHSDRTATRVEAKSAEPEE